MEDKKVIVSVSVEPDEKEKKKAGWFQRLFGMQEEPIEEVDYKGYSICPAPLKIARVYGLPPQEQTREGKWRLRVYISKGKEGERKEFNAANAYKSKKEAIKHCIEYGKEKVDALIAGKK